MKTAILGGSFDPVHNGHLGLARTVLRDTSYQQLLFIPAGRPPHKRLSGGAENRHRLKMLTIALREISGAEIWDGELDRNGPSYTIDTVRELKSQGYGDDGIGLIIGSDLVAGFRSWCRSEELLREVEVILAGRAGESCADPPFPVLKLDNEYWPWSSTGVRDRVQAGESLKGVVPPGVDEYIRENRLYGYSG